MTTPRLDFRQTALAGCPTWTPFRILGVARQWLIAHFCDVNNIVAEDLKPYVWKADETTGVLIETVGRWKPTLTEKRPGLILKRHEVNVLRQGVGADRLMGAGGSAAPAEMYSNGLTGSLSVYCIAAEAGACEVLATETYQELMKFAPKVREKLDLLRVAVVGVGELAKLEEARENFVIPVTLAFAFWDTTLITAEDVARMRGISLTVS